jgi:transposase InsO family protein
MLEKAVGVTRRGRYQNVEYARFADDLVVLVDSRYGPPGLLGQVKRRLREEFARLGVEVNEEKSRCVDLRKGESYGFLGFDVRRIRARNGNWRVQLMPKLKKRTALLRKLKDVFHRYRSQPAGRVVEIINPILRGWVTYVRREAEFVYLAVVLDAFSRKVVAWALDRRLEATLTMAALQMALRTGKPGPGLVHHSDRGVQYA